jgi:hypothetical protein
LVGCFIVVELSVPDPICIGQLEVTLLQTFIRAGKLKRWLASPECPAIIRECKGIFDLAYSDQSGNKEELEELPESSTPPDLQCLIKRPKVHLRARHRHNGVLYARASTHVGNSLIHFYPGGSTTSSPLPGSIKYIFQSQDGSFNFAVQRQLPISDGTIDPFALYPHFPAKLYSSRLGDMVEIIKPEWVMAHFARWEMTSDHAVVLSLSQY